MAYTSGRPRAFNSIDELEEGIARYFNSITYDKPRIKKVVVGYEDEKKEVPIVEEEPFLDNNGEEVIDTYYLKSPSILGLAHYLGVHRDTINEYSHKEGFSDSIKRAKEEIEHFLEKELERTQGQVTGIIFNLKNNFDWKDKNELEHSGEIKMPSIKITK